MTRAKAFDISVRLRARDGRIDQGGGVVWRAAIQTIIGVEATVNDRVVKVTIAHEATMHGRRFSGRGFRAALDAQRDAPNDQKP